MEDFHDCGLVSHLAFAEREKASKNRFRQARTHDDHVILAVCERLVRHFEELYAFRFSHCG